MKKLISFVALLLTLLPSLLYLMGAASLDVVKWLALAGTAVWFCVTPLWMDRSLEPDVDLVQTK